MASYDKEIIRDLIDGTLPWQSTKSIMSQYKDDDRFFKYIDILQERVKFNDQILLPIGEHLYIVAKKSEPQGERVVKCGCDYEFGHYTNNWKLNAVINVRDRSEEHTSELQSRFDLVCRLLLEKKKKCDD